MKTIENKTKKELMPLDMVRALMIEKGVDKAPNPHKEWAIVVKQYKENYYIPVACGTILKCYGINYREILNIGIDSHSKKVLPLDKTIEFMISKGVDKEFNINKAWNRARKDFSSDFYFIPIEYCATKYYGKTPTEILRHSSSKRVVEWLSFDDAIKIIGKVKSTTWNIRAKNYNKEEKKDNSRKRIPVVRQFLRVYGESFSVFMNKEKSNRGKLPLPKDKVIQYMYENKILEYSNITETFKRLAKKYENPKYFIPNSSCNTVRHYGKTVLELVCEIKGHRGSIQWTIRKVEIHLEDLYLLDKTQLLQIAFLKKLPKDIYEEILECPKGVERKRLLEDLPDRLEAIKDGKDLKTFEDSLDEAIEVTKKVQDEEEKGFKEELKTGVDFAEKPSEFNPEKKLKEILGGITALGNFNDGDYDGPEAIEYLVSSEIQKLWNVAVRTSGQEMQKLIEEYMLKKNGSKFFNEVINTFLKQYQAVQEFEVPKGYSFPYEPFMMQKLTALMISERRQFANWSETGSGKTISGVLTSRYIDSKITLVIAVNSTVSNWTENAIRQAYPNSKVYTKKHISGETKLDTNFYNYVVVNYEEFQNPDKYVTKWKPFLDNNRIDFVILDEVQLVKIKTTGTISNRRKVIDNILQDIDLQHGRNLDKEGRIVPVLALSATPVINSLSEVLSLLSLLTGTEFDPIKRTTRRSALGCHFELTKRGIRLAEELPAAERLITFPIKREFNDLLGISGINAISKIDTSSCLLKIGECTRRCYLQRGVKTLIYTDLVTNVIDNIVQYLQVSGFKVGEFTGRNERTRYQDMNEFINGNIDVLIASKPISTGVDGLQKICNRIIVLISAWTYAEYHQLVGRLNRKGTEFSEVEIIIPTVEFVKNNGDSWSLDIERLARIKFKKSLADVTINGNIPDEVITNEQALRMAKNSLTEFLKNDSYKSSVEVPVVADEIRLTKKPRIRGDRNQRDYFSEFQGINQRISTSTVDGVFTKIIKNEEDWRRYHELRNKAIGDIQDQTINVIARDLLKSRKHKIIADMGCGMNQLKTLLPNNYEVISVDMYAADETVKICNIINTSSIIPDNSLDVVVYSLSLWSRNWKDILTDAYRVLDYDGKVIIAEPVSSSSKSIDKVKSALLEKGFVNISVTIDANSKYYYMTANK